MLRVLRRLSILAVPVLLAACSTASEDAASSDESEINYRSATGQEFALTTEVTFDTPADIQAMPAGAEKDAALKAKADQIRTSVASATSSDLEKRWPEDVRITRSGVVIQLRQKTTSSKDIVAVDGGKQTKISVVMEFAAQNDIETKLPMKTEGGKTFYPLSLDLDGKTQELQIIVTKIERSLNAYPKYMEMFADGLDIGVHVGGDHNTPRQDLNHARSIYDDLVASGFRSPVAKFEDLKIDSGPLTSTIKVKGADVEVRVKVYHVDMTTPETRNLLVEAYKTSAKNDDVVIYDGHAGKQLTYSGVVVAYNPARVALPASEFKNLPTTGKQQIYLFNGCETYSGYADSLYDNPNNKPENTDIITTGNYSAIQPKATQVLAFVHGLIDGKTRGGSWVPRSWDSVLTNMSRAGDRSWPHVYGVHGLDDNPRTSPIADAAKLGAACSADADCGATDSKCISVSATKKVCGIACADTAGCPNGTVCALPRGSQSIDDQQCAPAP